jgi:hypothetical protein
MKKYTNINNKKKTNDNNNGRKTLSKSILISLLVMSTLMIGSLLLSYSTIQIFAQSAATEKTLFHNTQVKKSMAHNAIGHESHQVVQFIEPKNNTLYKGIITFTSSIPIDIIAYHDISNIADTVNKTSIKPWLVDGKTFIPTTIMKNVTSGAVDFISSGITTHIPYSQTYDVVYSIDATPFNKTK